MQLYVVVDDDGYEVDTVLFKVDDNPLPENYVPPNTEKRLFEPKWDFDKQEWTEGLSENEVAEKEAAIEKEQNKFSDEEMSALAILELGKLLMGEGE